MGWITGLIIILISTGGAGFIWTFERHVPSFRHHLPDRVHKLVYSSLIFAGLYVWPFYFVYTSYVQTKLHPPPWVWIGVIGAIILPPVLGEIVGIYWDRIKPWWETMLDKLFEYDSERYPSIPTAFDYVVRSLVNGRGVRPLVMVHFTDTTGNTPYLVIGYLCHASTTPYPQDMYINPTYFQGPEEKFEGPGSVLKKQDGGCLINYRNVTYTRILLPVQIDFQAVDDPNQAMDNPNK